MSLREANLLASQADPPAISQLSISASDPLWGAMLDARNPNSTLSSCLSLLVQELRVSAALSVDYIVFEPLDSFGIQPVVWIANPLGTEEVSGSAIEQWHSATQPLRLKAQESASVCFSRSLSESSLSGACAWTIPIVVQKRIQGSLCFGTKGLLNANPMVVARRALWAAGYVRAHILEHTLVQSQVVTERIASVMQVLSSVLSEDPSEVVLSRLVDAIEQTGIASTVGLAWGSPERVRLRALSKTAVIERRSALVVPIEQACSEAMLSASVLRWERPDPAMPLQAVGEHGAMDVLAPILSTPGPLADAANVLGASQLLVLPLQSDGRLMGSLFLARSKETSSAAHSSFTSSQMQWLDTLTSLLPQSVEHKLQSERRTPRVLLDDTKRLTSAIIGPEHWVSKLAVLGLFLLLCLLFLVPVPFKIHARTVIEGEIQRSITAPFEGYVLRSLVRPGDTVQKGQLLFAMDDRDLETERARFSSEGEQAQKRLREALGKSDLAAIGVARAQSAQANAQLELVKSKILRAQVRAPFAGMVISGDLTQLIGAPQENGKTLMELAPLDAYRVVLQVDERDIAWLRTGQAGELMLPGAAAPVLPFTLSRITPVANAIEGANVFRVEASLVAAASATSLMLRPGLEGVSKIAIGERTLWFVSTRRVLDWLRITTWSWLPWS